MDIDQLVNAVSTGSQRNSVGQFLPGNKLAENCFQNPGWQKIGPRTQRLLNEKSIGEILGIANDSESFAKLSSLDATIYARIAAAVEQRGTADTALLWERAEGKATQKTELTGKDGGPVTMITADATEALVDLINKIVE